MNRGVVLLALLTSLSLARFPAQGEDLPPYQRVLRGEDAKKAAELEAKVNDLADADQCEDAIRAAEELVALRRRVQGASHHEAVDMTWHLDALRKLAAWPEAKRSEFAKAARAALPAANLRAKGRDDQALPLLQKQLELRRELLGEEHPHVASSYNNVALCIDTLGRYAEAERAFRKALAAATKHLTDEHPETAKYANNLALSLNNQGKHAEAESLLRKALATRLKVFGEEHSLTAQSYNNLATSLDAQGRHADAETLLRKALVIWVKTLGEAHTDTANGYNSLGLNLGMQGKVAEAEPLLRKALESWHKTLGDAHPDTALGLTNLATNLHAQRKFAEAEALFRKSVAFWRKFLGPEHPYTVITSSNLALSLDAQDKHAEAEPILASVLAVWRKSLGDDHPHTAKSHNNLAVNLTTQGKHGEAETHFREGLTIAQKATGEDHPDTVRAYYNLAFNLIAQGKYVEAESFAGPAVAANEAARLRATQTGIDRAGFQSSSPRLVWAVALLHTERPQQAWQAFEGHLGRGLLDEFTARKVRILSAAEQRELDRLNQRLAQIEKQVMALLSAREGVASNRAAFEALVKDRKAAETQLAQLAARLQQQDIYDLRKIQAHLPADAALIGWLDQPGHRSAAQPGGDHWAFVLKTTGEPIAVPLRGSGPMQNWTKADDELPQALRRALIEPGSKSAQELARRLQAQRFEPLTEQLKDVKHLIVLPSEDMSGIPVELLTERFTVSYAPSGTVLTKLREKPRAGGQVRRGTFLGVGDPVFHQAVDGPGLAALPGTRREIAAIGAMFPKVETLLGADASKPRLAALKARLKEFDVIHLATHGIVNRQIALSSSVVLSQGQDDSGKLTALEMKDTWPLDAELVVLSACDSGLGKQAPGEGYLGFSQALFLAGARSIILSQWQVSDTATALLMVRFYENWLGRRAGSRERPGTAPMSKAEALKEAKHWLRNLTRAETEKRLANLPEAARGLKLEAGEPARPQAADEKPFAHPYYWSAFILIGDPD